MTERRSPRFDFRSDTVTLPTKAMMQAIATAPLGDAARGEDPTVTALEQLAAQLTGKEEALFLPSGAMANLCAVLAHGCAGGEVIVEAGSHIYNAEGGGLSVVGHAMARPVPGRGGVMAPEDIGRALRRSDDPALAGTRLICVENTHNDSGGRVLPLTHLAELADLADAAGVPLHMDGARLFNAAAHLELDIGVVCRHVDSVWFALCKGLGCPVGAVLAGTHGFIVRSRRAAKMLGGGMRQAGLLAAAGLVALDDPYIQHRRDNALARRLASGLAGVDPRLVDPAQVQTNIVNCSVAGTRLEAVGLADALARRGILVNAKRDKVRFVTHAHIDDGAVREAVSAVAVALG